MIPHHAYSGVVMWSEVNKKRDLFLSNLFDFKTAAVAVLRWGGHHCEVYGTQLQTSGHHCEPGGTLLPTCCTQLRTREDTLADQELINCLRGKQFTAHCYPN